MFASIGVLFILPWLDTSRVRSMRLSPIARQFFIIFAVVCFGLGWCGGQNPGRILLKAGQFSATMTWATGGQVTERSVEATSEAEWQQAADAAIAEMRSQGVDDLRHPPRRNQRRHHRRHWWEHATRAVDGDTSELLEEHIAEVKAEVAQATPFFTIERSSPARFTVTNFSLLLTIYYFLFFLVILPILGLRERPERAPDTIAKPSRRGHRNVARTFQRCGADRGCLGVAWASSEAKHPEEYRFSFESPTGSYDMAAVQRGFQVYNQVCSNCHSMITWPIATSWREEGGLVRALHGSQP